MADQPLEAVEALMRMNGYFVGPLNGLRVVAGTFEIDSQGVFHAHEYRIVSQGVFERSMNASARKKKVES